MFQSLNWHSQVLVAPACGLPLSRVSPRMPQQRLVESLPFAGPPEFGTHTVVDDLEPLYFVPRK